MKKTVKLLSLILAMLLLFCSCGEKNTTGKYTYSDGYESNGYYKDIKASDYVTLPDFKSISVTEDEINEEIEYLMNQPNYMKEITNKVDSIEMYDSVNIDYVGTIDGVAFDGGDTKGLGTTVQIGVTSYIDDFLDQLIGHRPGELVSVEVTFPDDYGNAELEGKDAVFAVTINYIVDYEKYELNDDFVNEMLSADYGWKTVEDLRQGMKGYFVESKSLAACTFADELPEAAINMFVENSINDVKITAANYSMELDDFIAAMYGSYGISTEADLRSIIQMDAAQGVQASLFYQAVAEENNITVSDKDIDKYFADNNLKSSKSEIVSTYGTSYVASRVLYDKVIQFIYDLI